MSLELSGKSIVVTGADSGIGRAIALECARQNAFLTLVGLKQEGLEETAAQIATMGCLSPNVEVADITDEPRMTKLFADLAEGPGLHGLVANAGRSQSMISSIDLSLEEWENVIAVNLTGTFITLRAAARAMVGQGGSIVVTGSSTVERPLPDFAAYVASKGGVHALVRALARELAPAIRVNLLVPGTTETPLTRAIPGHLERVAAGMPMRAVVQPEELASLAALALSDRLPHMTGSTLLIDSGRTLL